MDCTMKIVNHLQGLASSFVAILLLFVISVPAVADDTVVDVSYSHRQIPEGFTPDLTIVEGSIIAFFVANNPIALLSPDPAGRWTSGSIAMPATATKKRRDV